jgi:ribosome biogenesis protein NSA1
MPTFSGSQLGHKTRATCILFFVCSHVVVGSTKGKIMLIDLRRKGSVVQHYKGAVGSLKSIACHKTEPYIVSVGFDRHLLVHNLNSRALLQKVKTHMYWVRSGL